MPSLSHLLALYSPQIKMAPASILATAARRLEGKVALITGGASGIGRSTVELFTQHGAKVVAADIQDDLGRSVCESLAPAATYVHCDVTDEAQVESAVNRTVEAHGKLDIIFNNAGIAEVMKPRILDNAKADFERVLAVNVTGVFLGIKQAARVMIPAGRGGSIISTASMASTVGGFSSHSYVSSKHAVLGLTKNAAAELGQFGIRVNCISPYFLPTELSKRHLSLEGEELEETAKNVANLKGVPCETEDMAHAALFLASDDSRYVSGHNLCIDGAYTVVNRLLKTFEYPTGP